MKPIIKLLLPIITLILILGNSSTFAQRNPLKKILKSADLKGYYKRTKQLEIQIIYTQIIRDQNGVKFKPFTYNLHDNQYFYPASTIKLPVAVLALEKLNDLNVYKLDKYTQLEIAALDESQPAVLKDTTAPGNLPFLAHYIRKVFAVSDNDAYNRLYEFLGPEYINHKLKEKGINNSSIVHRLGVSGFDKNTNLETNAFVFFEHDMVIYTQQAKQASSDIFNNHMPTFKGLGFVKDDSIIHEPFDFTYKNRSTLSDLNNVLARIIFPEEFLPSERFNITEDDAVFLKKCLYTVPSKVDYPSYAIADFPDAYVKFLFWGDKNEDLPSNIKIYNKAGMAYGYMTDVSYITDQDNGIEFMLSAVIYTNDNGIIGDDNYQYESVGLPFLGKLGRAVYNYELLKKNKDLGKF